MFLTKWRRRLVACRLLALSQVLLLVLSCLGSLLVPSQSQARERLITFVNGRASGIDLAKGQFMTVRTAVDIGKVVVGDPDIATAVVMSGRSFYILGRGEGRTNVAVFNADDVMIGMANVEVGADTIDLEQSIQEAVPNANVRVDTVNGRIRLGGTVPDAVALRKVLEVAEQYGSEGVINTLRVTGGQQVMLEVRFVEASRNAGRELGISWFMRRENDRSGRGVATGAFRGPNSSGAITFNANLPSGGAPFGTILAEVLGVGIDADILVQALEGKGLARRLAEPNLVALSGDKASFLAGGEVPIPVSEEDGKVTVTYKEYGVRLNFTPTVLDGGLINLKLQPEVSEVDFSTTVRTGAIQIPAFTTRRADTTIELRDGQSFVIAGLLQSVHTKTQDQLPWLGQLPVLGALFRSSSFREQETDLVIIVTPRLVKPTRPGRPLRTPLDSASPSNDLEFFLLGKLEVDNDTLQGIAAGKGIIGPYGHIVDLTPGKPHAAQKVVKKRIVRKKIVKD
ncbi:BON domain-containing protein [Microvirga makkahensis]|uniref:BON domain-containing protein n=1 Tax=Microvirga makkahensis TaxID=1128670 RepID=A0A7X3MP77_9HYPH|nr:BON domain-containing protein [Microvirga makkahensis]